MIKRRKKFNWLEDYFDLMSGNEKYLKNLRKKIDLSVELPSHLNNFLIKSQASFIKAVEAE